MGNGPISKSGAGRATVSLALAWSFAAAVMCTSALSFAQDAAPAPQKSQDEGFFAAVNRWFSQQSASFNSSLKSFGNEAGTAAKTTVEGAKDAAGAVARIPTTRAVSGHEKCELAPNGAPDCIAAANTMCKAKGFDSGKSLDMTTAEICPPKVWMAGRSTGPECKTETFVSRSLCQ